MAQARQQVLAENVANADTPNYQAKNPGPPDFQRELTTASLALREPVPAISAVQATAHRVRATPPAATRFASAATARLTISALEVAGSVIAQSRPRLRHPRSIRPRGEPGVLIGNFLAMLAITFFATDMHRLVIAALNDNYSLFEPDEVPRSGTSRR